MPHTNFFKLPSIINALCEEAVQFEEIIDLSKHLTHDVCKEDEDALRQLELVVKQNNFSLIQKTAKILGQQFIENPLSVEIISLQSACFARYVIVPILYKLGFAQKAADLNQESFSYLFPALNTTIENKINDLFGKDLHVIFGKVQQIFMPQEASGWGYYSRIKSNQSIWKK